MQNLKQIIAFLYLISAFILVPILIYILWEITFDRRIDNLTASLTVAKIVIGLTGGYLLVKSFVTANRIALFSKIRSIAPSDFKPRFELYGCGLFEYIGMAPQDNIMVIIDMRNGISRCESMKFYQGWYVEEDGSFTFVTIRFNSFEFPYIKFQIPRKSKDEIIAKLNYAMQF